jgi:hypothetical protein
MSQYSVKIDKIRIQIRRINSKEIFSSYIGVEIRLIITEGEISKKSMGCMIDQRKNWWMKSVYKDDDIKSLIQ